MTVEEKILKKELKKVRKELKLVTEELRSMNVTLQSVVCNQNYLYFKLDPEGKNIERMLSSICLSAPTAATCAPPWKNSCLFYCLTVRFKL